jgi:hypothetical protein
MAAWFAGFLAGGGGPHARSNVHPHPYHHFIHTTPPPLPITFHHCLTRYAPNRAITLGFWVFGPTPTSQPYLFKQMATAPVLPHPHHQKTFPQPYPLPSHMADPKPSHNSSDFGFRVFCPSPLACLNVQPHPHHHFIHTTLPPLPTTLHPRFTWHT